MVAAIVTGLWGKWPEGGSLKYNTILQLMLLCKCERKWDEVPYIDAFMNLRNYYSTRRKCKLLNMHEGGQN